MCESPSAWRGEFTHPFRGSFLDSGFCSKTLIPMGISRLRSRIRTGPSEFWKELSKPMKSREKSQNPEFAEGAEFVDSGQNPETRDQNSQR